MYDECHCRSELERGRTDMLDRPRCRSVTRLVAVDGRREERLGRSTQGVAICPEGGSGRANRVRHAGNLHKMLKNRAEQTLERTRSIAA
ncbi:hypothetical protein BSIN_3917 [Burkholderia singularis]|uniref:Uncharacterized protein n=1 Tax=Burkholderia singularis TaxID=1503053 RepID=A0A238H6I0_9BURK|nr:hypothetical protein BSIN_3917 [Burkholderia singularis]